MTHKCNAQKGNTLANLTAFSSAVEPNFRQFPRTAFVKRIVKINVIGVPLKYVAPWRESPRKREDKVSRPDVTCRILEESEGRGKRRAV